MKKNRLSSIKLNIILYLVLFTAIPLIIASSVTLINAYKTKKVDLHNNHNQILTQVESDTNKVIQRIEYLGKYIKNNYNSKKEHILKDLIELETNITAIMILDENGIVKDLNTKESSNIFVGYDFSNKTYFEAIEKNFPTYWSKVYFSNTTQSPAISYAIRIDEQNIAIIVIDLGILNEFVEKFVAHDGVYMVSITDADGVFIAAPGNSDFVKERKNINLLSQDKKDTTFDKIYYLKNIGAQSYNNKLGWHIIVKEQYKYVFKTFFNVMWFVIFFIIILIIVSIFVAKRLAKSLLKPLHEVSNSMNKLSHGDYISNFRSSRYIELLQLVSSFSYMQEKIKQREESLRELNSNLEIKVNEKTKELQQLNESLEIRIKKEVESSRQKELHILETSKMVQMGEMIGNIAHQWRQPLSVISTAASGMRLEKEVGILDDEKLYFYCDSIVENTEHLSDTIETFRNFIRENKERSDVILQERIEIAIKIINATLASKHIELIKDLSLENPIKINIILGELSQAIINILNNAKDAILEKEIEDSWVKISCYEENEYAIITIEDNAGGIPQEVLPRIFEPYFSTKHKSQGTGLGLHMSYKIIVESLRGNIRARNSENGALFTIELPLSKSIRD